MSLARAQVNLLVRITRERSELHHLRSSIGGLCDGFNGLPRASDDHRESCACEEMHSLLIRCFETAGIDHSNLHIPSSARGGPVIDPETNATYFVRLVTSAHDVEQMTGEEASLRAMALTAPSNLVPRIHAFEVDTDKTAAAMITQYFDLGSRKGQAQTQRQLGQALARMHQVPPEGSQGHIGRYGFEAPTFCGATKQDNTWEEDWATFFRDRRLGDLVRRIKDREICAAWDEVLRR